MLVLDSLQSRLSFIALEPSEYWTTIQRCSESGIVGGAVYDALITQCAIKSGSETIYTWNLADFQRLGAEVTRRLRTP